MAKAHQDSMRAKLTSKGQVTIPKAIRDRLGVKPGDRVQFFVDDRGRAVMERTIKLRELIGIVPRLRETMTIEEMDQAIADHLAEKAVCGSK